MSDTKIEKHPDVLAWERWSDSPEGRKLMDVTTLGADSRQAQYLRNRLWMAFMAGAESATPSQVGTSTEILRVREAKEYPWGAFALGIPRRPVAARADGRLLLKIEPRDYIARSHGRRSRRELYWRNDFHVAIPSDDLRP